MVGLPEILILLIIVLLVVAMSGGLKKLPGLGRSAGKSARVGGEKAKDLAGTVSKKTDGIDSKSIANSAGRGLREAKELKEAITGPLPEKSKPAAEAKPVPEAKPATESASTPPTKPEENSA